MDFTLNIGLESPNGDLERFFAVELTEFILRKKLALTSFDHKIDFDQSETTVIVRFETIAHARNVSKVVKIIANALSQDCIAMLCSEGGQLVYQDSPRRDWGDFNPEFFINY